MRIAIDHETTYRYSHAVNHSIQSVRLTPRDHLGQRVLSWRVEAGPAALRPSFVDSFGNPTHTVVVEGAHDRVVIRAIGQVETTGTGGVVPESVDTLPPLVFLRTSDLTQPDDALRDLAAGIGTPSPDDPLDALHRLMGAVRDAVDYRLGRTESDTTAAQALANQAGVCQDHAHVFIAGARLLGIPARYVSGYLWANQDEDSYEASHAWAEALVPSLGWVGFDPANRICPTEAYVRVSVGVDYRSAAPVRGLRVGGGAETLDVRVRVAQSSAQAQS